MGSEFMNCAGHSVCPPVHVWQVVVVSPTEEEQERSSDFFNYKCLWQTKTRKLIILWLLKLRKHWSRRAVDGRSAGNKEYGVLGKQGVRALVSNYGFYLPNKFEAGAECKCRGVLGRCL